MAGDSAQQRYEQLRDRRQRWLRERWPWLVSMMVAAAIVLGVVFQVLAGLWWFGALLGLGLVASRVLVPPQSETAWRRGAEGERIVGAALDSFQADGVRVLHDRRIPGSRANIDHLVVTSQAVFTVDAKRYRGRLAARGGRLYIAGRDRSKLLEQARRQQTVVARILADGGLAAVEVVPVLCFVGVEWPLLFPPRSAGDVRLCSPRGLRATLQVSRGDAHGSPSTSRVAQYLEQRLPPAAAASSAADSPGVSNREGQPPPAREVTSEGAPFVGSTPSSSAASGSSADPTASESGYGTVNCGCGAAMVVRTRRRDGARFYGCSRYPQCRRTRAVDP